MILGFVAGFGPHPELCLVPDRPSAWSVPILVESLEPTESGVVLVSTEEGLTVKRDPADHSIELEALRPARLYLTPNLPERPGFSVTKAKCVPLGERKYRVFFDRDRGWEPWQPNVRLY
ncbi:MAG: hypothetical protein KDD69_18525 [Bdellovibrionales bacterium]|nr:hypothetical protein [Bdellovibrionales bacterium]